MFINQILLEHRALIHLCIVYGYFHDTMEELSNFDPACMPHKA